VRREIGAFGAWGAYINNQTLRRKKSGNEEKGIFKGKNVKVFPLERRFGYFIVGNKVTRRVKKSMEEKSRKQGAAKRPLTTSYKFGCTYALNSTSKFNSILELYLILITH